MFCAKRTCAILVAAMATGCSRHPRRPAFTRVPCRGAPLRNDSWGEADTHECVDGSNAFAVDLYARLKSEKGNLFFSPYSISTALAMTYAGARGHTEKQMAEVMHFAIPQPRLHAAFGKIIDDLDGRAERGGIRLSVANSLWGQEGRRFLDEFLDLTRERYGAELTRVDFQSDTEAARRKINTWGEKKTQGRIKELIPPGVLRRLTRLVLVNAIYVKAGWENAFLEDATSDAAFYPSPGRKVLVPTMSQAAESGYANPEGSGCQVLELPYEGGGASMVIFLPWKRDGLAALEGSLRTDKVNRLLRALVTREVIVHLPRFRLTRAFRLDETLKAMGMTDVFTEGVADLSGTDGTRLLFVHAVLHKAFVDVDEKGTEAASATAVVECEGEDPAPPPVFRADHPFLFIIRDKPSGSILFMGRVVDPSR